MAPSVLCVMLLLQARPARAQTIDESFKSDIEKLLQVTNSAQIGSQAASIVAAQVLGSLRKSQPAIPDRALEVAQQVLDAEFARAFVGPDSLTDRMVSIYAQHFTHDDVRGLLAFYGTDLGKKTIALMPVVFQEGAAAGQQWVEKQMPHIVAALQSRLRAEGFIK
jgi:hypothetical protein